VLGQPVATLRVSHPGPSAIVSVKLSDVSPDGEAQLVTTGILNLSHRESHREPQAFAGEEDVRIDLLATGWRFRAGHRVRVSVAGADWPTVWPLPTTESPELHLGACRIELPGVPADMEPFEPTGDLKPRATVHGWQEATERSTWEIVTDTLAGTSGIRASDGWRSRSPDGALASREFRRYEAFVKEADPLGADVDGEATFTLERPDVSVRSRATGTFAATQDEFRYDVRLTVREGGEVLHRKRWRGSVPRRLC
jgi:hypothetical protein